MRSQTPNIIGHQHHRLNQEHVMTPKPMVHGIPHIDEFTRILVVQLHNLEKKNIQDYNTLTLSRLQDCKRLSDLGQIR